jgi:hypothetical protein
MKPARFGFKREARWIFIFAIAPILVGILIFLVLPIIAR